MTPEEQESQFLEVAYILDADPVGDDYYRGVTHNTPFLCKLISVDPPTYMFKLRMMESQNLESNWTDSLPEKYSDANIGCEIEDDYIYLWIRDASSIDAAAITDLVSSCIEDHSEYFPDAPNYCFHCGKSGSASVVQSGASISSICDLCLQARAEDKEAEEERLNQSSATLSILLPLAIIISSFGWAVFWALYDAAFQMIDEEEIGVPVIVIATVVIVVGLALGWPTGKLLHRSGAVKIFPPILLSLVATAATLIIGELLFATFTVFRLTGDIHIGLILQYTLPLALGSDVMYSITKLIFAGALAWAIFFIAKPKEAKLAL